VTHPQGPPDDAAQPGHGPPDGNGEMGHGPPDDAARPGRGPGPSRALLLTLAGLAAAALLVFAALRVLELPARLLRPSESEIRGALYTAIQRESPETFLVTGAVDLTATTTVSNTRRLLPGIVGLSLGTTRATVRMPGRVSYGIDLSRIRPEDIDVGEGAAVRIRVPSPSLWSVEPVLSEMEVETDVGWARLDASGRAVEQEAIRLMEGALRAQGRAHLGDSDQPRANTLRALERALVPVLEAAGVEEPQITVLFTDTPGGERPE
jgi:hypothetical protein